MTTWYTSDLHLGHDNIVGFCNRPWSNVDEMNEGIVQNWNEMVHPRDDVYVLGDLALGKLDDSLAVAARLNGNKFLVPGNHDRCWHGHKKVRSRDFECYEEAGFRVISSITGGIVSHFMGRELKLVLLCHFPYTQDERHQDRYAEHHPKDNGCWLLHGHTHEPRVWSRHPRQIHVGMDAWDYRPVRSDWILEMIRVAEEQEGV